jgi:hypothetical protein
LSTHTPWLCWSVDDRPLPLAGEPSFWWFTSALGMKRVCINICGLNYIQHLIT